MATVTGGPGGTQFDTSNAQTASAVQGIFNAAANGDPTGDPTGGPVTGAFVATNTSPETYTGHGPFAEGALAGQGATYQSGTASYSTVYAGDGTGSTIENNNPTGTLFGYFGAGGNAGIGLGQANTFSTDPGSTSAIAFGPLPNEASQSNTLYSAGQDTVSINGPLPGHAQANEVVASGSGADSVSLLGGAPLTFVNHSTGTSTIEGGAGSTVSLSGTGNTSVQAGGGSETFNVDTASGNVTLTGSPGGADAFDFAHPTGAEADTGRATAMVNNFTSSDVVNLTGYGTTPGAAYTSSTNGSGTVVTLTDGTKINFTGVTDPSQVTSHINLH